MGWNGIGFAEGLFPNHTLQTKKDKDQNTFIGEKSLIEAAEAEEQKASKNFGFRLSPPLCVFALHERQTTT